MIVRAMQVTMLVDDRQVSFNITTAEKLSEIMEEPGSLGNFMRALRDAVPRVHNEGETVQAPIGQLGSLIIGMGKRRG